MQNINCACTKQHFISSDTQSIPSSCPWSLPQPLIGNYASGHQAYTLKPQLLYPAHAYSFTLQLRNPTHIVMPACVSRSTCLAMSEDF